MPDDKLKLVETCALLILMIEAREVPNIFLTKEVGMKLTPASRDKLERLGLIEVRTENRQKYLSLTDKGWRESVAAIGTELPQTNARVAAETIYRLVATLGGFLRTSGFAPSEFFAPPRTEAARTEPARTEPAEAAPVRVGDVAALIRKAYGSLAKAPGESVELVRIRAAIGDISPAQVDAALIELNGSADVHIFPESNQKTLTAPERAAAVRIGNQDQHLIRIEA